MKSSAYEAGESIEPGGEVQRNPRLVAVENFPAREGGRRRDEYHESLFLEIGVPTHRCRPFKRATG